VNKLLVLVVLAVAGKFGFDALMEKRTDQKMARVVEEMNAKLPISTPYIRLEKVAYSERTLRMSGRLFSSQPLTEEAKAASRAKLKEDYCAYRPVVQANVGIEYAFAKVALASMNDRARADNWELSLRPEDCK
jgi:hypothetical protein